MVVHNTFVIERSYAAAPARVFAAFADPAMKRRWLVEGSDHSDCERYEMEFRVGGKESFANRFREGSVLGGMLCSSEGWFLDIVPGQRIVQTSGMSIGENRISTSMVTFELAPDGAGTALTLTHQAAFFEGADGPGMREAGWRKLLENLAAVLAG